MSANLTFSVMNHNPRIDLEHLKSILSDVNSTRDFSLNYQKIDYATGWADFVRNAIHGSNLDVSEMGTSWINDFAAMNSLRPFSSSEISNLGGEAAFPAGLWRCGVGKLKEIYAVPWMTWLSLVYYRRDLFQKAGIEESDAFSTPEKFEQTLAALSQAGVASPLAISTRSKYTTLHYLEIWLWSQGTDFVDPTGTKVMLNEPNAYRALRAYFDLHRHLPSQTRGLTEFESDDLFARGDTAVTISGPSLYSLCRAKQLDNVGVAIPLGQSIVGGSSLVVWKSSPSWEQAIKLISILSNEDVQTVLPKLAGMLPGRLDMLERFQFSDDSEINHIVDQAVKNGRSVPYAPFLGMIEDRLEKVFEQLWTSLFSNPEANLDQLLEQIVVPAVNRINITLST